jgi:periplasmic protein TonB
MKKSIFLLSLAMLLISFSISGKILSQDISGIYKETSKFNPVNKNIYPDINTFVFVNIEPVPLKIVRPIYPSFALKTGQKGAVFVKVLIDENGKPKDALVIKSTSIIFNNSAISAALKSSFEPAIKEGNKVSYWVVIPYSFKD